MNVRRFERIQLDGADDTVIVRQKFAHHWDRLGWLLLASFGLLICLPLVLIASSGPAAAHAAVLAHSNLGSALKLIFLLLLGPTLLATGIVQCMRPRLKARIIRLTRDEARVCEHAGGAIRRWRMPLDNFDGLRHIVTTTSSGALHTLQLENVDRRNSLLLACEPHLADCTIAEYSLKYDKPVLTMRASKFDRFIERLRGWRTARSVSQELATT